MGSGGAAGVYVHSGGTRCRVDDVGSHANASRRRTGDANSVGNRASKSCRHSDVPSGTDDAKTIENATKIIGQR